ncbi:CGNR zinc finger domain-containing protein, partial [Nonomuraea wenchangensis]
MQAHSTKAMAARAVDLCVALLHRQPTIESVSRVLREHGETGDLGLGEADVAAMRAAAARLREVLAAPDTGRAAALLNRLLADTARAPRL